MVTTVSHLCQRPDDVPVTVGKPGSSRRAGSGGSICLDSDSVVTVSYLHALAHALAHSVMVLLLKSEALGVQRVSEEACWAPRGQRSF